MAASKPAPRSWNAAQLAVIGSEMFGFAMVGLVIDFALGTIDNVPWATLILGPLGVLAGFVHLYRLMKR